ncbi:single-stranded DNA-binding protein [Aliarcobacter cryaerophilus]|uniref:single-stranded DNA-binding protein n=1 Tax=Aliarcobacter cryaerophilus TaxID=28198 RepID=UPI003DA6B221
MFNRLILIGNLTKDIELKYLPSGSAVAKSSIATSYKYKSQSGEQKEEVCFLEFNLFGRSAEVANQYLHKGSKVLLEGRLIFEQWNAQDGSARSKHSLRVDEMKMLDSKPSENNHSSQSQGNYQPQQRQEQPKQQSIPEIDIDEEIPF